MRNSTNSECIGGGDRSSHLWNLEKQKAHLQEKRKEIFETVLCIGSSAINHGASHTIAQAEAKRERERERERLDECARACARVN